MEIRITYKGTLTGIKGIWCGFKPEGAIIEKEISILYPAKDMLLRRKGEEETHDPIILTDGDSMENYEEVDNG